MKVPDRMTESMLERMARAIYRAHWEKIILDPEKLAADVERNWVCNISHAQAAIQAVFEGVDAYMYAKGYAIDAELYYAIDKAEVDEALGSEGGHDGT